MLKSAAFEVSPEKLTLHTARLIDLSLKVTIACQNNCSKMVFSPFNILKGHCRRGDHCRSFGCARPAATGSLDLRLGVEAWRVQAGFLPGQHMTVLDKLQKFGMHKIDLSDGAVLERGCVYIVEASDHLPCRPALRLWPILKFHRPT